MNSNFYQKIKSFNFFVLLPFIIFTFLLFPFFNLPACNDAGTEYSKSTTFYGLGLQGYLHAGSLHPPFKPFLANIIYHSFGQNIITYHLLGLMIGYIGILAIYLLCKTLFNKNVALISAILLSTFPLFLANTLDNYTDFCVAVFSILALYFYSKDKYFFYALAASATTLSKDTGLLLPLVIFLIELYESFIKRGIIFLKLKKIVLASIPLFVYILWFLYVRANGVSVFNEYIFANTSEKGAFVTILYNFFTLNFFSEYAQKHMLQLFYLNFIWIYWIIIFSGFLALLAKTKFVEIKIPFHIVKSFIAFALFFTIFAIIATLFQEIFISGFVNVYLNYNWVFWPLLAIVFVCFIARIHIDQIKPFIKMRGQKIKTVFAMALFFVLYAITIGTFQIWDTPRYNLPLIPFVIIAASVVINRFITKVPVVIVLALAFLNFTSLFFSIDPVSIVIWNRGSASGQTFYTINSDFIGDDALAYNLQYLLAMEKRAAVFTPTSTKVCTLNN